MKTLRLIGMALIAILMSVNFTSCSDDDEETNEEGVVTNEKKLITIEIEEKYGGSDDGRELYSFAYDNKNRVISVTTKDYHNQPTQTKVTNIEWKENQIVESRGEEYWTLTLADERVIKEESFDKADGYCNYSFAYDSSKRLSASENYYSSYNSSYSYSWDNDKLVKYIYSDDDDYYEETQIKYNEQTCKGFFPLWGWLVEDDCYTFIAHPELVGFRNNYLPSQIIEKSEYGEVISNMSYTFNKDGYVESCTVTEHEGSIVYTFKWQ